MADVGDTEDSIELDQPWAEAETTATLIVSMHDESDAARIASQLLSQWPEAPLPDLFAELFLLNDELEETILAERYKLLSRYQELGYQIVA